MASISPVDQPLSCIFNSTPLPKTKMQITIFGITRPIGAASAKIALDKGHTVVALVRNPSSVPETAKHPNLKLVKGDALDPIKVEEVVQNADAVLSFIGSSSLFSAPVVSPVAKIVTDAMNPETIYVTISQIGVTDASYKAQPLIWKAAVSGPLRRVTADKAATESIIRASNLQKYVILRGSLLSDAPGDPRRIRVEEDETKALGSTPTKRDDLAMVAMQIVLGERGDTLWKKAVAVLSE